MILGFITQLNDKPTYFVEKIWETILQKGIQITMNEFIELGRKALPKNYIVGTYKQKLHTIREDKKDRWQVGTKIDFFINCRQKDMFRFAPVLPVVSVQKVEIIWIGFSDSFRPWVRIDGKSIYTIDQIDSNKMLELAHNDGFDSIEDFFAYFNEDFTGKLIHWTDLKY
jgi:hypothetical protein